MERIALAVSLGLLSATAAAQTRTGAKTQAAEASPMPPDARKTGAILLTETDLEWIADPKRPGTYLAYAEGDPAKGPAHFYLKYEKGFAGGLHYHTSDHGGWILSGTVVIQVDGKERKLPPGSFYFITGKKPHIAKCDPTSDCVMTVDVRGKWDAVSVKE